MNHLQNFSVQARSFVRRNFNIGIDGHNAPQQQGQAMTDEENRDHDNDHDHLEQVGSIMNPLQSYYIGTERVLGRYFPVFLYFFVLVMLFLCAVALTAIGGDGTYPVAKTTTVESSTTNIPPWNASGDIISANDVQQSSSDSTVVPNPSTVTTTTVAAPSTSSSLDGRVAAIALFLSMSAFSALITVLALRLMQRARAMSGQDPNRTRMQQVFARLAAFGQYDPEVRSRLRLAMMNRDFNGEDYEMLGQLDNHNARGMGATEIEINRLPIHTITRSYLETNNISSTSTHEGNVASPNSSLSLSTREVSSSSRSSCSICLAPYEEGEVVKTG